MKDYVVKYINLENGERMAYREAGTEGPIFLMIHGNQTSSVFFQNFMEKFEHTCRVYAIDLIGCGDSSYNRQINSLREFSEDVALFMKQMELSDAVVLGWSTGGGIALELAADHPEYVKKIILLDSVGLRGYTYYSYGGRNNPIFSDTLSSRKDIERDPIFVYPMVSALRTQNRVFIKAVFDELIYNRKNPPDEDFEKYVTASMKQRNFVDFAVALAQFNITSEYNGVCDGSGRISQVKCPIAIIHGDNDLIIYSSESKYTKAYLKDQATLTTLSNCGHDPMVDRSRKMLLLLTNIVFR